MYMSSWMSLFWQFRTFVVIATIGFPFHLHLSRIEQIYGHSVRGHLVVKLELLGLEVHFLPVHEAVPHPIVVLLPDDFLSSTHLLFGRNSCARDSVSNLQWQGTHEDLLGHKENLWSQLCAQLGGCHKIPVRTSLEFVKSVTLQGSIWQDSLERRLAIGWTSSQFPENAERTTLHADFLERSPTERQRLAHLLSNRTETSVDTTVSICSTTNYLSLIFPLISTLEGQMSEKTFSPLSLVSSMTKEDLHLAPVCIFSRTCSRHASLGSDRVWEEGFVCLGDGCRRFWGRRVPSWRSRDRQVRHHKFVCRRANLGRFLRACTWRKWSGDIFLWLLACCAARVS